MLAGDVAALDALLDDDLSFTDQSGNRLSKADDLAAHQSGLLELETIDIVGSPDVRRRGNCATVCVTVDLAGFYDRESFFGRYAYRGSGTSAIAGGASSSRIARRFRQHADLPATSNAAGALVPQRRDAMADDKNNVGVADRSRISLSEEYEIRDWTASLGVSEQELRKAVDAVGNSADAVPAYWKK